jgi:transposase
MEQGELESLGADEPVVPASEAKQLRARVRELKRLLGKNTLEAEILKEALKLTHSKKLLLRSNWPGPGDSK